MGFETLTISVKSSKPLATLSYMRAIHKGKSKPGAMPQLRVTIPTSICACSKADKFGLQLGTGADAGRLRVIGLGKDADGVAPLQLRSTFRWNFGYVPRFGEDIFDGERFPVTKISDDIFEITMPLGFIPEPPPKTASEMKTQAQTTGAKKR